MPGGQEWALHTPISLHYGIDPNVNPATVPTLANLSGPAATPLKDVFIQAKKEDVSRLKADDEAANAKRLYGIVVLSDGQDAASKKTKDEMFRCLPSGEDVEGIRVFTISYGNDADKDLLLRIATRTNGKAFSGDPSTIESVCLAISTER